MRWVLSGLALLTACKVAGPASLDASAVVTDANAPLFDAFAPASDAKDGTIDEFVGCDPEKCATRGCTAAGCVAWPMSAPQRLNVCQQPASVWIADMDADGRQDLLVGCGGVLILKATGPHAYAKVPLLPGAGLCIVTGDFNADGRIDIATGTQSSDIDGNSHVGIFPGTGRGTFGAYQKFPVIASNGTCPAAGDVDGDRIDDLVVGGASDTIRTFYGGNPPFVRTAEKHTFGGSEVGLCPLDAKSGNDIVMLTDENKLVRWTFEPFPRDLIDIAIYPGEGIYGGPLMHDFDRDGNCDAALTTLDRVHHSPTMRIRWGDGRGNLTPETSIPCGELPVLARTNAGASSDLNGDGRPDIVLKHCCVGRVQLLLSQANRTFVDRGTFLLDAPGSGEFTVGDLDGDGYADLVYGEDPQKSENIVIYWNGGKGKW